jgi:hypothetical protein
MRQHIINRLAYCEMGIIDPQPDALEFCSDRFVQVCPHRGDPLLRPASISFKRYCNTGDQGYEPKHVTCEMVAVFVHASPIHDHIIDYREKAGLSERMGKETLIPHIEMDLPRLFVRGLATRRDGARDNELLKAIPFNMHTPRVAGCKGAGNRRLSDSRNSIDKPDVGQVVFH